MRTDGHDEANSSFSQFCESDKKMRFVEKVEFLNVKTNGTCVKKWLGFKWLINKYCVSGILQSIRKHKGSLKKWRGIFAAWNRFNRTKDLLQDDTMEPQTGTWQDNVHTTLTLTRVPNTLLPWKSNKYYIFVCVCVCVRARARLCVCARTRGRVHERARV